MIAAVRPPLPAAVMLPQRSAAPAHWSHHHQARLGTEVMKLDLVLVRVRAPWR